jgi:hypothetical protein
MAAGLANRPPGKAGAAKEVLLREEEASEERVDPRCDEE